MFLREWARKTKRIIDWIPTLWKDEDWDPVYLYRIMEFKISRMRKEIDSNALHLNYKRDVKNMKIAEELLSRMSSGEDNFYWENNFEQCEFQKRIKACPCVKDKFGFDKGCPYCRKMFRFQYTREDAKEKADAQYLWRLLEKQSGRWWD